MQPSMAHNMVGICFQSNADADADADAARLVVRWVVEQLILVPPVYRENLLNLRETHALSVVSSTIRIEQTRFTCAASSVGSTSDRPNV